MSFVKWGIDYTNPYWSGTAPQPKIGAATLNTGQFSFTQQQIGPQITTEVCIDGVPVKKYQDMQNDNKDLIRCLRRLLPDVGMTAENMVAISEARNLLARLGHRDD